MSIHKLIEKKRKEQKKKENLKRAKIVGMTALGVSTGAIAGVLFAPKSGKETRNDIVDKTKQVQSDISRKTSGLKETVSEKITEKKSNINEAKEKISEYLAKKRKEKNLDETINPTEKDTLCSEIELEGEI